MPRPGLAGFRCELMPIAPGGQLLEIPGIRGVELRPFIGDTRCSNCGRPHGDPENQGSQEKVSLQMDHGPRFLSHLSITSGRSRLPSWTFKLGERAGGRQILSRSRSASGTYEGSTQRFHGVGRDALPNVREAGPRIGTLGR